ncbi:Tim44 domain-containing protein [Aromatoleum diolicum]|uniref:Tim44 domain-containing protein n=1 Tax=Aromatoleum diolicum TaxID=75796 RepID=A0ABX1QB26_9RHOO|nr:TIM44-like domain-containing protein [Aromatoleum diolicum]NMG74582.1 Tim44 domain-containing protein [Aromatoleum diolicum]
MKNFILSLIAVVITFGFSVPDVEAKRLGGGSSLGMQRQATPQQAPRQSATTSPQQTPTTPPKRSWMGPLAGLAAGLGLAALFSHLGMGEELASIIMIALLAFGALMLFRLLTRRKAGTQGQGASPMQYAGASTAGIPASPPANVSFPAGSRGDAVAPAIPHDFDTAAFVRQAKVHFIRLQAAHDAGNVDDIRDFTTPEMFAEIRLQMADRGNAEQRTDVVELNADVLEVAEEAQRYIVSVRFNGLLREEANAAPAAFDEIWHLTKPRTGNGGWVVAGIQQVA